MDVLSRRVRAHHSTAGRAWGDVAVFHDGVRLVRIGAAGSTRQEVDRGGQGGRLAAMGETEPIGDGERGPGDETVPEEALRRLHRSLRRRIFAALTLAILGVVGAGGLLIFAPREHLLILLPLLLALEFVCGFVLSGKLMTLALARHHDKLRGELLGQQEATRKALVARWMSLEPGQRDELRARFPDVDWSAIDGLAGSGGGDGTKH